MQFRNYLYAKSHFCAPSVTRTHDLRLRRQSLYPAELWVHGYSLREVYYNIFRRWYNSAQMKNIELVFILFLFTGLLLTIFAFCGLLFPFFLSTTFFFIVFLFVVLVFFLFRRLYSLSKLEQVLVNFLIFIWALHFLQVLVPETGFDALWYHLPVVKEIGRAGGLIYLPQLYQSVNPLFSDLYFLSGYSTFGIFGTKMIAYIFASLLSIASYYLARLFIDRKFSLLVTIFVSTFQVVSWQSASFYVDVAKAFFEIVGLFFIFYYCRKNVGLLFFSASLSTKLFSILLLPFFIFSFGFKDFFAKKGIVDIALLLTIPFFYYYFAYLNTGNPFYSFALHTNKLQEIGGHSNPIYFILEKMSTLPRSLVSFVIARDYVNPVLVLFFIPLILKIKNIWLDTNLRVLFVFSVAQWLVWWFVPPLSTRYALSGFISLLILGITVVVREYIKNKIQSRRFLLFLLFLGMLTITPRVIVANRSLKYILTNQTQKNYMEQFYDGSIDEKINNWYGY